MDEAKSRPKRGTRARSAISENSFEDLPTIEKKKTRSKNQKNIDDDESVSQHNGSEDFDDSASSKSSSSVRSCKVVLRRENFDELKNDERPVSHATRGRRNSKLTEENVAAHSNPSTRSLRSGSVASEGTEATETTVSRTRSARLAQNTPKKESNAARPATPSRRSSRLISENEKAADSPAKPTPAKRSLRSNSIISDDVSPPISRTRSSSRLAETLNATPKSLKTKASKIKAEPLTPRRASARVNKSVILSDIIDEESTDDENTRANKTTKAEKVHDAIDEQKKETVEEAQGENVDSNELVDEKIPDTDESTVVSSTVNDVKSEIENVDDIISVSDDMEAPSIEVAKSPCVINTADVLIATSTAKTSNTNASFYEQADTPTVEPAEPMETSVIEQGEKMGTPKAQPIKIVENVKTPVANSPRTISNDIDSKAVTPIMKILSPSPSKPKSKQNTPVAKVVQNEMHDDGSNDAKQASSATLSLDEFHTSNVVEEMDVDVSSPAKSTTLDESAKEVLKDKTPQPKARASNVFNSMNVTALIHEEEKESVPTPNLSKKSSKRMSLNDTTQSTGFDRMEVSVLVGESEVIEKEIEQVKTTTPKAKSVDKVKSPMMVKSPIKDDEMSSTNQLNQRTPVKKIETPKSMTPKSKPSPKKTPFADESLCLNTEIEKIIAGLNTPIVSKKMQNEFNKIATELTPVTESFINEQLNNIKSNKMNVESDDKIQEAKSVEPDQAVEKSILIEVHEASVIDTSQPSVDNGTPLNKITSIESVSQEKNISTSGKKSVQIMTPKMEKSRSCEKRIDTPYPSSNIVDDNVSSYDAAKKKRDEMSANGRAAFEKLKESWTKSLKRNSISSDSPQPIDKLGVDTEGKEEESPMKKSVPARNNWNIAEGLIDSESEPEEEDVVSESDLGSNDEIDEESDEENSFLDDGAEVIEDYNSGDSMDEEEKLMAEENVIDEGEDIGSEDSECDDIDEDYDYSDGFIVEDGEAIENPSVDEDEEIVESRPKKRASKRNSRIIRPSSSEESGNENSNSGDSNQVVSIPMDHVESVVVVEGNPPNDDAIVEGKKFGTTYLTSDNEETATTASAKKVDPIEKSAKPVAPETVGSKSVDENQDTQNPQTEGEKSDSNVENSAEAKSNVNESMNTSNTKSIEVTMTEIDKNTSLQDEAKKNKYGNEKIMAKKQRTSLPGIDRLGKDLSSKKANRMSLGDLNPNRPNVNAEMLKIQKNIPKTISKGTSPLKKTADKIISETANETRMVDDETNEKMNESSNSTEISSSNNSKNTALKLSSQEEENNNQTSSVKKGKAAVTFQTDEIIPMGAEGSVTSTTAGNNDDGNKDNKKTKSKRKFEEIEIGEEQMERPKTKKMLKVIRAASGIFIEEPMTPEKKNKHGFQVTPLTPVNPNFRVEKRMSGKEVAKSKKRKNIYLDEEEAAEFLPKPRWVWKTQLEDIQASKRTRKLEIASTEVIVKSLEPKKSKALIQAELLNFRQKKMYRAGIPREDLRAILREKYKKKANFN